MQHSNLRQSPTWTYLWLILWCLGGCGHRALPLRLGLRLLLVDLVDGGRHLGGGHGGLLFLPLLLAPPVHAEHPLAEALGRGEMGGERVVGVVEHVPVIWGAHGWVGRTWEAS